FEGDGDESSDFGLDRLGRSLQLLGQAAVGHEQDSDHRAVDSSPAGGAPPPSLAGCVPMGDPYGEPLFLDDFRESLRDVNGAVLAAGAADPEGEVALVLLLVSRHQVVEQVRKS